MDFSIQFTQSNVNVYVNIQNVYFSSNAPVFIIPWIVYISSKFYSNLNAFDEVQCKSIKWIRFKSKKKVFDVASFYESSVFCWMKKKNDEKLYSNGIWNQVGTANINCIR